MHILHTSEGYKQEGVERTQEKKNLDKFGKKAII